MTSEAHRAALLIMDVQPGIIDRLAPRQDVYLDTVRSTVDGAHAKGIPVIYVVVGFRPGFPEISPDNKSFSTIQETFADAVVEPRPALTPTDDDLVTVKRRVSAFSGSDLEVILRAKGIRHLVLSGIATSGVVLSTLREAADKDFQITVLSDLCADSDEEVHSLLLQKIFPRQANVVTSRQWLDSLRTAA